VKGKKEGPVHPLHDQLYFDVSTYHKLPPAGGTPIQKSIGPPNVLNVIQGNRQIEGHPNSLIFCPPQSFASQSHPALMLHRDLPGQNGRQKMLLVIIP
jgi:hypothetical protein